MLDKRIKVKWYQLFSQITNQISSISVIVSSSVWVHHAEVSSFELLDLFCFFCFFLVEYVPNPQSSPVCLCLGERVGDEAADEVLGFVLIKWL